MLPLSFVSGSYEELEGHVVVGEVPGYNAEEYQADAEYQDASYNNEGRGFSGTLFPKKTFSVRTML